MKAHGYALRSPSGELIASTITERADDCWGFAYQYLEGRSWMRPYYKNWEGSKRAARRRGWRIVRCEVREVKK